ncbi:MAG: hypothetical protein APF82_04585 [Sphingomonadales bacterium BRH_c42]|nr:MAG: hypothetical protein APF82_04585 [Sphingomonadales bacterium BRH_c42]
MNNVKPSLSVGAFTGKAFLMGEERSNKMSREERLAAKLRENLRLRKAQARAIEHGESGEAQGPPAKGPLSKQGANG